MPQSLVQLLHAGCICALLGRKDVCCALCTVQRVVNVAHDGQGHIVQCRMAAGQVDVRDVRQRDAGGHKAAPLPVEKTDAQRGGCAAAAVVGAAAAQTQYQTLCAVVQRRRHQLSHAVGGGAFRIQPSLRQRQPRSSGALHHSRAVGQQAVEALRLCAEGVADHSGHALPAAGIQKAVHGAFAAVGHRQGVHLPAGDGKAAGDAADGRGGQRALEGIGDHETAFHGGGTPFA